MTNKTPKTAAEQASAEADVILRDKPVHMIAGREHTIKRFGIPDVFKFAKIFATGAAYAGQSMSGAMSTGQDGFTGYMLLGLAYAEKETLALLAYSIDVSVEELSDPDQYPVDSIVEIIEALSKSQDIQALMGKFQKMMQKLPEAQNTKPESKPEETT